MSTQTVAALSSNLSNDFSILKKKKRTSDTVLRVLIIICAFIAVALIAPVLALDLVWLIADILNALMAIPNLIAVLLLSGVVVRETERYLPDLDLKCEDPVPTVDR